MKTKNEFVIKLATRLKELRGSSSQAEMARQLEMMQPQWARYENGASTPSAEVLAEICEKHACSADWLLGLTDSCSDRQNVSELTDWRVRALAAEAKLERVNRALGHALKGFEELQEAVKCILSKEWLT